MVAGLSFFHNIIIGVVSFISLSTSRDFLYIICKSAGGGDTENVCLFDHFTTTIELKEKSWFLDTMLSPILPMSFRNNDFLWHETDCLARMNFFDILGRFTYYKWGVVSIEQVDKDCLPNNWWLKFLRDSSFMQIEISSSLIIKFGDDFFHKLIVWVNGFLFFFHRGQLDHKSELWLVDLLELL